VAWTTPITWTNAVLTSAQMNAQIRDNMNETAVAKASAAGQYFTATGVNSLAARAAASDVVDAAINITSATYVASTGPSVTITTGVSCLVMMYCLATNNTTGEYALCTFDISGATTSGTNDNRSIGNVRGGTTTVTVLAGATIMVTGMTPGSSTIRLMYKTTNAAATATFDRRRIAILPF
jgi:hypothetical protein